MILGKVTTYGYPGDTTPDLNSSRGIGAWDNKLRPGSMAVSRDIEKLFVAAGIAPRCRVRILLADGTSVQRFWDDRTAKFFQGKPLVGRFDFYYPDGKNPFEGVPVIGFERMGSLH
jgi:hypothetical protein